MAHCVLTKSATIKIGESLYKRPLVDLALSGVSKHRATMSGNSVFGFYADITFTLVTISVLLAYWYFTSTFNHWRDRGVCYLEPTVFYGTMKDIFMSRLSFHEYYLETYKKFAGQRYCGIFVGRTPNIYIRDPELIKCVMVRDFDNFVDRPSPNFNEDPHITNILLRLRGSRWKSVRTLMTPAFSIGKIKAMAELVRDGGTQISGYLRAYAEKNNCNEFELKTFFGKFMLEVIANCAFGVEGGSLKDEDAEFPRFGAQFGDISKFQQFLNFICSQLPPKLQNWFPLDTFNKVSTAYLANLVKETKKRRESHQSGRRNDFIQLMLDAAAIEESGDGNKVLDESTIIAQSILFIIAGFDTTSTLLTFASYELALNPDVQTKLRQEIVTVLDKYNNECSYEALQEMHYLDMVLWESLRKHPPLSKVDRVCTKRYIIPGTDVAIEKDVILTIPVLGLHYDPEYYPDPERFDPDRFLPEEKSKRSQYVYLPFGYGQRNCIGSRFALMSSKIAMTYLLKEFELKPGPKTEIPFTFGRSSLFLKAENGIWITVTPI